MPIGEPAVVLGQKYDDFPLRNGDLRRIDRPAVIGYDKLRLRPRAPFVGAVKDVYPVFGHGLARPAALANEDKLPVRRAPYDRLAAQRIAVHKFDSVHFLLLPSPLL